MLGMKDTQSQTTTPGLTLGQKLIASLSWYAAFMVGRLIVEALRHIGTTWTNEPGLLRLAGLGLWTLLIVVAPLVLAVLAWFGQPRSFYKKLIG